MLKWPLSSSDNYHLKNFINKIVFWLHHCMKKSWLLKQHHQINLVRITNCNIIYMVHLLSLITGDHTKCHLDLSNQTTCILVQLSNSNWVYTLNWTNNITIPVCTTWVISVWSVYMIIQSNFGASNSDQSNTTDGSNWLESPIYFPYISKF